MAVESDTWDDTDRQIACLMQIYGRVSWGAIARILEVSERTVTRRGQRLLDRGVIRVSTYHDVTVYPNSRELVLRMESENGRVSEVAAAIARFPEASSVSILEGQADIVALMVLADRSEAAHLLLDRVPQLPGVKRVTSMTVLQRFRSGYDWRMDAVSPEVRQAAIAEILPEQDPTAAPIIDLSEQDEALIELLASDGRLPITQLAAKLEAKPTVIRRRVDQLIGSGSLRVRAEVHPRVFGLGIEAMVWLRVPTRDLERIGRELSETPAVRFCSAVTGASQLMIDILAEDEPALMSFLTERIGALHGVEIGEIAMVVVPVRRGPLTTEGLLSAI